MNFEGEFKNGKSKEEQKSKEVVRRSSISMHAEPQRVTNLGSLTLWD